jgi:hypothetical protein
MAMAAILVADWGALGAVIAFAAGSTALKMLYALRLWQQRRVQPVSSEYLRALAAIVAALATTQFVLAYLGGEPAVRLVAAAGIYPCALLGLLVAFRTSEPKLLLTGLRHLSRRLRAAV